MNAFGTLVTLLLAAAAHPAAPKTASGDRLTAHFSDRSRPGWVVAHVARGGITVMGYDGTDVVIETGQRGTANHARLSPAPKRLPGLSVKEHGNIVVIETEDGPVPADLVVRVPARTSLRLRCADEGNIVVEQVRGELEVQHVNGSITLTNVFGSALANTTNGSIKAVFAGVDATKAMSFVTLNGDADVALPRGTRANVKMKVGSRGDISSDFEVTPSAVRPLRLDRSVSGVINGGGQEITLRTYNGNIVLRESK